MPNPSQTIGGVLFATAIDNIGEQAECDQGRHGTDQVAQRGYAIECYGIGDVEENLG